MDRDRFDRLSRLIGAAGTRRDALRTLVAGAIAGATAATLAGADESEAKRKRRNGRKRRAGSQGKKSGSQRDLIPLQCPNTCNQNCSNKPLIGGANLSKCNLNDRDLDGVNLGGANLSGACFGNSSLRNANFRGANLSGTCFCGADLTGADFRGTSATLAQLQCGTVACNTILPNGKPAVPCARGERCCNGECVLIGSDPDNCGRCGVQCGTCQFCNFGTCEDLPDLQYDCNRAPLITQTSGLCTGQCTDGPNTGICDGGICNCGPRGVYNPASNVCQCDQDGQETCAEDEDFPCCEVTRTCLDNAQFCTELTCVECGFGGSPYTNLCCEYLCAASGPGPRPKKFVCIENAEPGHTRCDASFEGCSFNDANFVQTCGACGA
jgi:hypothetical protein